MLARRSLIRSSETCFVSPIIPDSLHDGRRLPAADRAREHVGPPRRERGRGAHDALVNQLLGYRLVPRDLSQQAVPIVVVARVAHLQQIHPRPHTDEQRQRRGHATKLGVGIRALEEPLVRAHRRVLQQFGERLRLRVRLIVRRGAVRDVLRDVLEHHATRLFAGNVSADAVSDHGQEAKALVAGPKLLVCRQ
jgi:hypothetical protein